MCRLLSVLEDRAGSGNIPPTWCSCCISMSREASGSAMSRQNIGVAFITYTSTCCRFSSCLWKRRSECRCRCDVTHYTTYAKFSRASLGTLSNTQKSAVIRSISKLLLRKWHVEACFDASVAKSATSSGLSQNQHSPSFFLSLGILNTERMEGALSRLEAVTSRLEAIEVGILATLWVATASSW